MCPRKKKDAACLCAARAGLSMEGAGRAAGAHPSARAFAGNREEPDADPRRHAVRHGAHRRRAQQRPVLGPPEGGELSGCSFGKPFERRGLQ
eukprot:3060128-Pyramimonas_sp.AAC.1